MRTPGYIIHRGASRLDAAAPVVAIVTASSLNAKTGDMAQAWILRDDVPPHEAIRDGRDRAICGDCVHRSGSRIGRSCYVVVHYAPLNVWKAYQAGDYLSLAPLEASRALSGQMLRLAAYGDPAAVPVETWRALFVHLRGVVAYSHQWRTTDPRFQAFTMASVDSAHEAREAQRHGWRTFRTRTATEPLVAGEIVCPASDEGGHRTTCDRCGLCQGRRRKGAKSIAIIAHGQRVRWFADAKAAADGGL